MRGLRRLLPCRLDRLLPGSVRLSARDATAPESCEYVEPCTPPATFAQPPCPSGMLNVSLADPMASTAFARAYRPARGGGIGRVQTSSQKRTTLPSMQRQTRMQRVPDPVTPVAWTSSSTSKPATRPATEAACRTGPPNRCSTRPPEPVARRRCPGAMPSTWVQLVGGTPGRRTWSGARRAVRRGARSQSSSAARRSAFVTSRGWLAPALNSQRVEVPSGRATRLYVCTMGCRRTASTVHHDRPVVEQHRRDFAGLRSGLSWGVPVLGRRGGVVGGRLRRRVRSFSGAAGVYTRAMRLALGVLVCLALAAGIGSLEAGCSSDNSCCAAMLPSARRLRGLCLKATERSASLMPVARPTVEATSRQPAQSNRTPQSSSMAIGPRVFLSLIGPASACPGSDASPFPGMLPLDLCEKLCPPTESDSGTPAWSGCGVLEVAPGAAIQLTQDGGNAAAGATSECCWEPWLLLMRDLAARSSLRAPRGRDRCGDPAATLHALTEHFPGVC